MGAGAQLAKKVGLTILGDLIFWLGCKAIKNKLDGKTVFGKKIDPRDDTYVDWKGNIILGEKDGMVV